MGEKPGHWVASGPDAPLHPVGPAGHVLGGDELLVEVDACTLWHQRLNFAFGFRHGEAQAGERPHARIAGHVIEAGEDALYFVDRTIAMGGAVPCGEHEPCWTGGDSACPNKAGAGGRAPAPHYVVVSAHDVSVTGERVSHASVVGLAPFEADR